MKSIYTLLTVLFLSITSYSQINITDGLTGQALADILAGSNINVTNVTYTGSGMDPTDGVWAAGSFTSNNGFDFDSGVILSTGDVLNSAGPNDDPNTSDNLGYPGTQEMADLGGSNSWDVATLEFDFVVQSSTIQFEYMFASEDYPEAAPPNQPSFNDVFAFFISGPGITGDENIALIPGTTDPVTIDNINPVTNSQYYVDNEGGLEIQEDGYTVPLVAFKDSLVPCETYHLRLVISDIHNTNRNSAVYLKANSFVQENVLGVESNTASANGIAREGCKKGSFTFEFDEVSNQDRVVSYAVGGSAVNGVDYAYLDTFITIPAGETSGTVYIDPFSDGITEGQETVELIYPSGACFGNDTVYMYIDDSSPISFDLTGTDLQCFDDNSGEVFVDISGGVAPYTLFYTEPNGTQLETTNNPVTGLGAGEYSFQVEDLYGCRAEPLVIGGIFDADTTFLPDGTGATYTAPIDISGFNPGQVIESVDQIKQLCATMEHSYLGDLEIRIVAPTGENVLLKGFPGGSSTNLGIPFASGPVDGDDSNLSDPGEGYEYCFGPNPTYGTMINESGTYYGTFPSSTGGTYNDSYLPEGSYTPDQALSGLVGAEMNGTWTMEVTDNYALDNGYIFNWYISLEGNEPDTLVTLTQPDETIITGAVTNATCGGTDGAINTSVSSVISPYTVQWDHGPTNEDLTGLGAGDYTMTVTDANSCPTSETFYVNSNSSIGVTASISRVECYGDSTGAIDITISGGTSPYTTQWSNGATTEDIVNLTAGEYVVSITDQNGCIYNKSFTVNENSEITISRVAISDERCNTNNGAIDLSVTGGSGLYGYNWSNGSSDQDITDLNSGNYTVDIVDGYGCTQSGSFTVNNDLSNCSAFCYLDVEMNELINENCGQANGSIDINILNAVTPYEVVWEHGPTSEDLSGLAAGTYTVTITDGNSCSVTQSYVIENETGSLDITNVTLSDENCSNSNGSIDISVSGGTAPYSFDWSNGATTEDLNNLSGGTYLLTLTDGNNCQLDDNFTIKNNSGSLALSGVVTQSSCNANSGTITQEYEGANGTVSFLWDHGATTQSLTDLAPGEYTSTITDETGCSVTNTYTIVESTGDLLLEGINITNEECGDGQGAINITVSGNNPTFLWSNGATTEDLSGISGGIYSCEITNDIGCSIQTGNIEVINSSGALNVTTKLIIDEICSNGLGSIDMNVSGGLEPYSFQWSHGPSDEDVSGLSAGLYTLQTIDANNCKEAHSIEIQNVQGTLEIISAVVTNEQCADSTGSVDITADGGTTPLNYSWSNGSTTEDLNGVTSGFYEVTLTDSEGCEVTDEYAVSNNAGGLDYVASVTNEVCTNGQGEIVLEVTGGLEPYTYEWSIGSAASTVTGLSSGTYYCTVTDANNCTVVTEEFKINNTSSGVETSTVVANALCADEGSVDLTITGALDPVTINWSNGDVTEDIYNLTEGTYDYVVEDGNGCVVSGSATVNSESTPIEYTASSSSEMCGDTTGAISLTVSGGAGGYTYVWSNGATTEDLTNLTAGSYSCTITDAQGCSMTTDNISVANQSGDLDILNVEIYHETCSDSSGAVDVTVTGSATPLSYSWSNGATTQDLNGIPSGTYTVEIIDTNNCATSAQAVVESTSGTLEITQSVVSDETCHQGNGEVDISLQGGVNPINYTWNNGEATQDLTGLSAGIFDVLVVDSLGCKVNASYEVSNAGENFIIESSQVSEDYCNSSSGSIETVVSGGNAPYNYTWSSGESSSSVDNLSAGDYTLVVEDQGGCQIQEVFTVNSNSGTLAVSGVITNETCGEGNGAIDITTSGGTAPLSYGWNNGEVTEDLANLSQGDYVLEVTDAYNCTSNFEGAVINESSGLSIVIDSVLSDTCGQGIGAIYTTISSTGTYSVQWDNGAVTENLTNLNQGAYTITITDDTGCAIQQSVNVNNETSGLELTYSNVQEEECANNQGFIDIEVTGTAPITYLWSNGSTSQDITQLGAGTYSVEITDGNGCIMNESFTVESLNNSNIGATASITNPYCTASNGAIDITTSGGIDPFTYSWSSGEVSEDISGVAAGTYTVVITDDVGCSGEESFNLTGLQSGLEFTNITVNDEYCGNGDGYIEINTSGTADYYYFEGSPSGQFISGLSAGSYDLRIEDNFGCSVDSTVTVGGSAFFYITETITDVQCYDGNGQIVLQSSTFDELEYTWSTGLVETSTTGSTLSGIAAGTYTCTVSTLDGFCSVEYEYTVLNDGDFDVDAVVSPENCRDGSGAIDQTVVSGSTISYNWSTGAVSQDISGLSAGTYSCTISAQGGCTATFIYEVSDNNDIESSGVVTNDCGNGEGAIDLTVTGGSGNYSYTWNTSATSEDLSGLNGGEYVVSITDNGDNCQITDTFYVTTIYFDISVAVTDESCSGCTDGTIDLTPGNTGYSYNWSNGATTEDIIGLAGGLYECVISSGNCDTTITLNVGTVGIESLVQEEMNWKVYPNPASNEFVLTYNFPEETSATIEITDLTGKIIQKESVVGTSEKKFNTYHMSDGVYLVRVRIGKQSSIKKLVIIRE